VGGLNPSLLPPLFLPLHLSPSSPALRPLIEKVGLPMFSPYSQAQRQSDYFSPAFITPPTKGGTIAWGVTPIKIKKYSGVDLGPIKSVSHTMGSAFLRDLPFFSPLLHGRGGKGGGQTPSNREWRV
jgi:hypothetical protein